VAVLPTHTKGSSAATNSRHPSAAGVPFELEVALHPLLDPNGEASFEIEQVLTERVDHFVVNGRRVGLPVMGDFEVGPRRQDPRLADSFDLAQLTKQLGQELSPYAPSPAQDGPDSRGASLARLLPGIRAQTGPIGAATTFSRALRQGNRVGWRSCAARPNTLGKRLAG
jgi:hypothetical protein